MKKWEKKEKKDAKDYDSKRTKASGNQWYAPGDSKNSVFLVESKQTSHKSYSLNVEVLDKLYEEALFSFRLPLLSVKIQETEVVVLFKNDFLKLFENKTSQ